jgi:YVTN family beta-propeller protein
MMRAIAKERLRFDTYRQQAGIARRHRFSIAVLAMLVLVGSLLMPSARPALAETSLGNPITAAPSPFQMAVNPFTNRVYLTSLGGNFVTVLDGTTNAVVGQPITVGLIAYALAFNPTTFRLYVSNYGSGTVSVIDAATNTVVGQPITVGLLPRGIAANPVTNRIYVANSASKTVSVIDGATNAVIGQPVPMPEAPYEVAVNPATNRVYVTHADASKLTVIDGATNAVIGAPIPTGVTPEGVAVNPLTNRIYVANAGSNSLSVIDGATNTVVGQPIPTGSKPYFVAVNPATSRVYVTNFGSTTVTVVDTSTDPVRTTTVPVGPAPVGVAVNPLTGRVYVANDVASVSVVGIELKVEVAPSQPVGTVGVTWASQFPSNGADFVGLFDAGAPNDAPLNRTFTNGTGSPGGPGVGAGTVNLTIPPGLPPGQREVRFVSGAGGGTFGVTSVALPTTINDSYLVAAATPLSVQAPGVLANDRGQNGTPLQARVVGNPANGTLALQPNGGFSYTPNQGFTGIDRFTYQATDPTGLPGTATVAIAVGVQPEDPSSIGVPPVAANDAYTVDNGSTLTIAAPGLLANDTDPDSPALQVSVVSGPAHGTLDLQPNGGFSYTPRRERAGTDTFTYRATDPTGLASTATVSITVNPITCGPRPTVQVQSAVADGALQVTVSVSDVNGPTQNELRELRFAAPVNGRITLNGQAQTDAFTHTPPAGTARVGFSVQRVTPGQATTVPLTVVDRCGTWPTFVGGGANSGF